MHVMLYGGSLSANEIDPYLMGGHLLTSHKLQQQIHTDSNGSVMATETGRCYDIYHDPNLPEVMKCPPVLEGLVAKVTELLKEWPDHPTLKQVRETK